MGQAAIVMRRFACALCAASFLSCARSLPREEPVVAVRMEPEIDASTYLPEGDRGGNEYKRGNTFPMAVWWEGPAFVGETKVVARLTASRHPGATGNTGADTLPDFFFEDDLNPAWRFPADYTDKIAGVQALEIEIILPRGQKTRLVASCFDWGGRFRVDFQAAAVSSGR